MINHYFENVAEMIDEILEGDYSDDYEIVADYKNASLIIKEFLCRDAIMPEYIEINNPHMGNYTDEYYITTLDNDLFCECAKVNGSYLHFENRIVFLVGDISTECIDFVKENALVVNVLFKNTKVETIDAVSTQNMSTYVSKDEDGNPIGFSRFWSFGDNDSTRNYSFSFFSDNKEEVEKIMSMIEGCDTVAAASK